MKKINIFCNVKMIQIVPFYPQKMIKNITDEIEQQRITKKKKQKMIKNITD